MALGGVSALASIRGGGLLNYMMNRERALNDPAVRASLAGSPFAAGVLGVTGGEQDIPVPGPQGQLPPAAGVVAPSDMLFGMPTPPVPAPSGDGTAAAALPQNVPGYIPGTQRRWMPNLPPYSPEESLKEQSRVSLLQNLVGAGSDAARGQAKMAAGIMPTPAERDAVIGQAKTMIDQAGPGSVVRLDFPGSPVTVGSPYGVTPTSSDEYPTPEQALAVANSRGTNWTIEQTGRGTWRPVQKTPPAAPPPPATQPPPPTAQPPAPTGAQPPPAQKPQPPAPTVPVPSSRPAAPPRPSVHTGTPGLDAGFVTLPAPSPAAPPYPGGPYDPNAIASTPVAPRAPRVGYPSPAFDDTGAPAAPAAAAPEAPPTPPVPAVVAVAPAPAPITPWAPPTSPPGARGRTGAMDPQAFVQGLVNRGWSVPEASAAAGNVHVESGFRPGIVAPNGDTGLLQWNGARLAGMQRYAAASGRDWRDPEAQLDWIAMERSGGSRQFGVDER